MLSGLRDVFDLALKVPTVLSQTDLEHWSLRNREAALRLLHPHEEARNNLELGRHQQHVPKSQRDGPSSIIIDANDNDTTMLYVSGLFQHTTPQPELGRSRMTKTPDDEVSRIKTESLGIPWLRDE